MGHLLYDFNAISARKKKYLYRFFMGLWGYDFMKAYKKLQQGSLIRNKVICSVALYHSGNLSQIGNHKISNSKSFLRREIRINIRILHVLVFLLFKETLLFISVTAHLFY